MKYKYKYILHGASYSLSITLIRQLHNPKGFPDSSVGKESACNAGDTGSISGSGRSPGGGNGNSLQYSKLENLTDRGAWQIAVQRITKSQTGLSD